MVKLNQNLWVIECPYCHKEIRDTDPPCPHCGVWWNKQDGPVVMQAGPAGAHVNVTQTKFLHTTASEWQRPLKKGDSGGVSRGEDDE